jgi:hypothetical protein
MSSNFGGRALENIQRRLDEQEISPQIPQGKQVPGGFLAEGIALPADIVQGVPPVGNGRQPIGAFETDREKLPQAPPFRGVLADLQDRR